MEHKPTEAPLRIVGGQLLEARRAALAGQVVRQPQAGPHRLEPVASLRDVLYINDSKATFLDATLESFMALDRPVVWIAGAWGEDMAAGLLEAVLRERVTAVVLFGPAQAGESGSGEGLPGPSVFQAGDLRTAVFLAHELARSGDAVLFSPACPSGNGFANYEERGAEFKRAVRDL